MLRRIESRLLRAQGPRAPVLPWKRLAVANLVRAVRVASATAAPPTIIVIAVAVAVIAKAATEGITAATIRAEAVAMIAAHVVAVKAENRGPTAVPDKAVATRMVMAAEIVAIVPLRMIRLMPRFARA